MPVLLITPVIQHATPRIHLAFNHYGVGHYDAVVFGDESNDNQSDGNEECAHHHRLMQSTNVPVAKMQKIMTEDSQLA